VRDAAALIEFRKPGLNLIVLPAFRLDERRDGFRRQERLRAARAPGERLEAFLGVEIDANGKGRGHLCLQVCRCVH
jgi:hypothetical protein